MNNICSESNSYAILNVSANEDLGIMAASYLMYKIGKVIMEFFLHVSRNSVTNKEASSRLYAELLCRQRADDICRPPVKSRLKSCSRVVHTSSAHHPHVVCTRFQPQKYFQLNSRATALLKIMTLKGLEPATQPPLV